MDSIMVYIGGVQIQTNMAGEYIAGVCAVFGNGYPTLVEVYTFKSNPRRARLITEFIAINRVLDIVPEYMDICIMSTNDKVVKYACHLGIQEELRGLAKTLLHVLQTRMLTRSGTTYYVLTANHMMAQFVFGEASDVAWSTYFRKKNNKRRHLNKTRN